MINFLKKRTLQKIFRAPQKAPLSLLNTQQSSKPGAANLCKTDNNETNVIFCRIDGSVLGSDMLGISLGSHLHKTRLLTGQNGCRCPGRSWHAVKPHCCLFQLPLEQLFLIAQILSFQPANIHSHITTASFIAWSPIIKHHSIVMNRSNKAHVKITFHRYFISCLTSLFLRPGFLYNIFTVYFFCYYLHNVKINHSLQPFVSWLSHIRNFK